MCGASDLMPALLADANACVADAVCLSAADFPQNTDLASDQAVHWVSSSFDGHFLINIFAVIDRHLVIGFVALRHGDGGVVLFVDGPFDQLDQAEAHYQTAEGWTRI